MGSGFSIRRTGLTEAPPSQTDPRGWLLAKVLFLLESGKQRQVWENPVSGFSTSWTAELGRAACGEDTGESGCVSLRGLSAPLGVRGQQDAEDPGSVAGF